MISAKYIGFAVAIVGIVVLVLYKFSMAKPQKTSNPQQTSTNNFSLSVHEAVADNDESQTKLLENIENMSKSPALVTWTDDDVAQFDYGSFTLTESGKTKLKLVCPQPNQVCLFKKTF